MARELRPDAITLDVMMPGMDGWAVLTALKSDPELAEIPVIMVTIVDDKNLGLLAGRGGLPDQADRPRAARGHPGPIPTRRSAALVVDDDETLPRPDEPDPGERRLDRGRGRERPRGPRTGRGIAPRPDPARPDDARRWTASSSPRS